ncbi:MAG: preprotein translocase subunit YajC [Thermotogaceae bacterium]|nr:preprotein translocase subunit YajC [Thermotogaceae bacterium]
MSNIVFAGAPGAAPAPTTGTTAATGGWGSLLFMLLIFFLMFYFLIILPQRKREKEFQKMIADMKRGDTIITAGGVVGKIIDIKKDTVKIKTANTTELEVTKRSIATVIKAKEEKKEEKEEK